MWHACIICAGEICLVLEGADGAAHAPIHGPPGIDAAQRAEGDAAPAGANEHATPAAQAKSAQLERARPLLRQLIKSGGSRPRTAFGRPAERVVLSKMSLVYHVMKASPVQEGLQSSSASHDW